MSYVTYMMIELNSSIDFKLPDIPWYFIICECLVSQKASHSHSHPHHISIKFNMILSSIP